MKNSVKRIIAVFFVLTLLLLNGCSKSGGENTDTSSGENTTEATTKSEKQQKLESKLFKKTDGFYVDLSTIEKVGSDHSFFGVYFDNADMFFSSYLGSKGSYPAEIIDVEKVSDNEYTITVSYSASANEDGKEETLIEKIKLEDSKVLFVQADTTTFTYMGEDFYAAKEAVDKYMKEKDAKSEKNTDSTDAESTEAVPAE